MADKFKHPADSIAYDPAPSVGAAPTPDAWRRSDWHSQKADIHEIIATHYRIKGKPGIAAKHRHAAELHTNAYASYSQANRSKPQYKQNWIDRGDEACQKALDYEKTHDLKTDEDSYTGKKLKD